MKARPWALPGLSHDWALPMCRGQLAAGRLDEALPCSFAKPVRVQTIRSMLARDGTSPAVTLFGGW